MDHIEVRWDNDKNDGKVFSPETDVMSVVEAVIVPVAHQAAEETRKENSENRRDRKETYVRTRSDEAKEVFRLKNEEGTDSEEYIDAREDFKKKHFNIGMPRDPIIGRW